MRISGIAVTDSPSGVELAADLDGFRLWYRLPPGWPVWPRGDAFLPPALLAAMTSAGSVDLAPPAAVSPLLLQGAARVQEVLNGWDPRWRKVPVRAAVAAPPPPVAGNASFFSGGVDAAYTLHQLAPDLTHLILLRGCDLGFENDPLFASALQHAREVASTYAKRLVMVETNSLELCLAFGINPHMYYGAILAGAALALGFARTYVSSGLPAALMVQDGSHYLLDRHWSTESEELVNYGGEMKRNDKLRALTDAPVLLKGLRVCLLRGAYNCGSCEKCLRTMVALRLLGLHSEACPALRSTAPLRGLRLVNESQYYFWRDNYELAVAVGDREVARALRSPVRGYLLRRALSRADRAVFRGGLQRARGVLRRKLVVPAAPLGEQRGVSSAGPQPDQGT